MAGDLHDASTDIEARVKKFIKILTGHCAELHMASVQLKRSAEATGGRLPKKFALFPEKVTLRISRNRKSLTRTPAQQAKAVSDGGSWVCWGGHMSDKARHVILVVDGTPHYGLGGAFPMKEHEEDFKRAWTRAMKAAGLRNYKGKDGYASGDEFHVELPNGRIPRGSSRARACMDEYVRLTREKGKPKNTRFEDRYRSLIKAAAKRIGVAP